jgi:hypothetical protein
LDGAWERVVTDRVRELRERKVERGTINANDGIEREGINSKRGRERKTVREAIERELERRQRSEGS